MSIAKQKYKLGVKINQYLFEAIYAALLLVDLDMGLRDLPSYLARYHRVLQCRNTALDPTVNGFRNVGKGRRK